MASLLERLRALTTRGPGEGVDGEKEAALMAGPNKVCVIGSGNWGSTAAMIVARNCASKAMFNDQVTMWVFDEVVDGRNLSEIINTDHENTKYLPGHKLPDNVVAEPDLATACRGATVLIFVVPHQFLGGLLPTVKANMAPNAVAISLIKGIDFDAKGVVLVSDVIRDALDVDVSVLMGANVASEIAAGDFAEATVGGPHGPLFKELFNTPSFHITCVAEADAVELCGALKNIVALGAGFCDGLGFGNNTKAAVIRIGLLEMGRFIELRDGAFPTEVLLQSCGTADLITTCYGGRNRRCAEAFVRTGKSWAEVEEEVLNGQKLQGTLASAEVNKVLLARFGADEAKARFPLFTNIYAIAFEGADAATMFDGLSRGEALAEK